MTKKTFRLSIGTITWLLFILLQFFLRPFTTNDLIATIVLFAILIVIPMILPIVQREDRFFKSALVLLRPAGVLAAYSFLFPQGWGAVLLALPWFAVTLLFALSGLASIVVKKQFSLPGGLLENVALVYIAVGGTWLILHQSGLPIMDFSNAIILLTAIHFHYAAFIAPILVAFVGKQLSAKGYSWISIGMIISPPLVAIGITGSDITEVIGVSVFVATLFAYAVLSLFKWIPEVQPGSTKLWFAISSLSLIVAMVAAFLYDTRGTLTITQMVWLHGVLNSFGFAFFGALGVVRSTKRLVP
ncbi:MAG TPA: YndJ family protein [Bacillales bacterium]|nr:YndJ family protein [Bacillales bacterium]